MQQTYHLEIKKPMQILNSLAPSLSSLATPEIIKNCLLNKVFYSKRVDNGKDFFSSFQLYLLTPKDPSNQYSLLLTNNTQKAPSPKQ
jgi:hypothetical protein